MVDFSVFNNCTCREPGRRVIYLLVKKDGTKNVYKVHGANL